VQSSSGPETLYQYQYHYLTMFRQSGGHVDDATWVAWYRYRQASAWYQFVCSDEQKDELLRILHIHCHSATVCRQGNSEPNGFEAGGFSAQGFDGAVFGGGDLSPANESKYRNRRRNVRFMKTILPATPSIVYR